MSDTISRCEHEICDITGTHWIPTEGTSSLRRKSMNFEWDTLNISVEFLETQFSPQSSPVWYQALYVIPFYHGATVRKGPRSPHYRGFMITLRHTHSVGLLWASDQSDTETSTRQHTAFAWERHPCLRRDLNPQFQQAAADARPRRRGHWDHRHTLLG